jgi:8-oxo-dGTP diphosphatase
VTQQISTPAGDTKDTDRIHVVDVVAVDAHGNVLMISRVWEPFQDHWAIPGGHVEDGEELEAAARREFKEETSIDLDGHALTLVGVYDAPGRDPRGPYVSSVYVVQLPGQPIPKAADDAKDARWFTPAEVLDPATPVAFDHRRIITDALARLA